MSKLLKNGLNQNLIIKEVFVLLWGQAAYGTYYDAPWIGWDAFITYFPEFAVFYWRGRGWQPKERDLILKSITLRINKKKDTVRQTNPELFNK